MGADALEDVVHVFKGIHSCLFPGYLPQIEKAGFYSTAPAAVRSVPAGAIPTCAAVGESGAPAHCDPRAGSLPNIAVSPRPVAGY